MKTDAKLSICCTYRYTLWRTWAESKPYAMFVGLNPSTADEDKEDLVVGVEPCGSLIFSINNSA